MPQLTIDGRVVEAKAGASVLEAALANGINAGRHSCWNFFRGCNMGSASGCWQEREQEQANCGDSF